MKRSIYLTRLEAGDELDLGLIGAIRLRIVADRPVNVDPAIFVYQMLPKSPHQDEAMAVASHVASPTDMANFPINEPNPGIPFFRLTYIDFPLNSTIECNETWERTVRNVDVLLEGLKALDALTEVSTVCIGDCDDSDSASTS